MSVLWNRHVLYPSKIVSNLKYVIIIILDDWCKHCTTKFMQTKEPFYFTSRTKCLNEQTLVYGHNNWIWVSKFYLEQLMSRKHDFNSWKIVAENSSFWYELCPKMIDISCCRLWCTATIKSNKNTLLSKNVKMKIKTLLLDKNRDLSRTKLWWCNWVYKRYKKIKIMSCNFNIKDDQYRKALFLCWSYKEWMWELKYRYKAHCIPLRHHVCKNTWFYYFLCWLRNK